MESGTTNHGDDANKASNVATEKAASSSNSSPDASQVAVDSVTEKKKPGGFKDYIRIFSYANKMDNLVFLAGTLASIGSGATMPLLIIILGKLVNSFNSYGGDASQVANVEEIQLQTRKEFNDSLNQRCLYLFALFIARLGLSYISKWSFRSFGLRISAAIRLHYMRSLFGQTIHVLDSMPSGSAAITITTTSNVLQLGISEQLGNFIESIATIIAAIIIAFVYSWSLTLVTSSVLVFILFVVIILSSFIIVKQTSLKDAENTASAVAYEAFSAVRMIVSCGAEARTRKKHDAWIEKARQDGLAVTPLLAIQYGLVFFSLNAAYPLTFWFGTKSYDEGRIDNIGTIIIVLMSVMYMVTAVLPISAPLDTILKATGAATEFFAVIDTPKPKTGTLQEPDVNPTSDILFNDVHFAYPARPSKKVLDGLNLRIQAKKNTAIVGPSGAGKSTIVGLIQGWYTLHDQYTIRTAADKTETPDPGAKPKDADKSSKAKKKKDKSSSEEKESTTLTPSDPPPEPRVQLSGSISTCGHEIEDINMKWWRSQIGLVQQEPFLFNDTIYKNISFGLVGTQWENESEEKKRELVKVACKESFADEFIDRLPDGYDTQVGDSGIKLSGGQRQRLAIARSIISQPKILILDEATSAIDVRGERIVQAALERASKGRTTITIAHRLSTIKNADHIVVLQHGKLAEQGTHHELLNNPEGVYYGLVNAQKLSLGEVDEDFIHDRDIAVPLEDSKSFSDIDNIPVEPEVKWKDKNLFTGFGRLLYEQRSRFPLYAIALVFAAGASVAVPLQAYFFAHVIAVFETPREQLLSDSVFWSKMWTILAAGVGFSYFMIVAVATNVDAFIATVYRQEYFGSILQQKISFFDQEDNSTGQLTARVATDPDALKQLLGINMSMPLIGIFSLIGALAISFYYGWKLALVALCVIVPFDVLAGFYRIRYEMQLTHINEAVLSESAKFSTEAISAFRTVSSLVMEESICDRYEKLLYSHVMAAYKKVRWTSIVFAFSDSVNLGCQALILWYGGRLLSTGEYGPIPFFITYMAIIQGAESAGQWLSFGANAAQASEAANRILSVRGSQSRDDVTTQESVPDTTGGVKIQFDNVFFKYPTRDLFVFKGLNLTVEKGQYAALVGASGSGKTSVISLLERFYDAAQGQILFNGKDIKKTNVHEYRKLLSLVAQEPYLFSGSIRENILLGVNEAEITDEQLHQCCRDANIHDFIVSLPDGYATNVGSKGVSLSGGQKQRISIARALIRNPQVLLLDEATSSLDSESEKLVQASFEKASKNRTTIVVAHRLATIQNADIIYVLGGGEVLEKGSHAELLRQKGAYWSMCQNQALDL